MKKTLLLIALAGILAACGGETKKQLEFVPDETPDAGVFLRLASLDEQTLTLDLVGKEIARLYGLAFRLQYDPAVLNFAELSASNAWPADSISVAHQTQTGVLISALTSRGSSSGLDFQTQVLATLRFQLLEEDQGPIDFIAGKCALVNTSDEIIPDRDWAGGSLELR